MQTQEIESNARKHPTAIALNHLAYHICQQWMFWFSLSFGLYVGLPFLAPFLMAAGLPSLGKVIYLIYSFFCHQLPERSFFLFGPKIMIPLADIYANWQVTNNPFILRQFIGNSTVGWKVAWSDRMVYMFTSTLVFAWIWWPLRKKFNRISWKTLALFLFPMALDGGTHFLSELAGLHQGFRDTNAWLAGLTSHAFSTSFYSGDAWGSFNSIMRMVSGILFGVGIVWFGFPFLAEFFQDQAAWIKYKFERAKLEL